MKTAGDHFIAGVMTISSFAIASSAQAQCEGEWIYGPGQVAPGLGPGPVCDMIVRGAPGLESLVCAGEFTSVNGEPTSFMAAWDGDYWSRYPNGPSGPIYGVREFQGDIVVAGTFTAAGGLPCANVARYDGTSWHPLGPGFLGTPSALTVHGGLLCVGGTITSAGGSPTVGMAAWNGQSWSSSPFSAGQVRSFLEFEGSLYIGGQGLRIGSGGSTGSFRSDASGFHALGDVPSNALVSMVAHAGQIYGLWASGSSSRLYRLEGVTWTPLTASYTGSQYSKLISWQDQLLGTSMSTGSSGGIALWNGTQWIPYATGFSTTMQRSVADFRDELVVGGSFTTAGNVNIGRNITRWTGSRWAPLGAGVTLPIADMARWGDELAVAGPDTAGNVSVNGVAVWNGGTFRGLGGGIPSASFVLGVGEHDGELIAVGMSSIARRWDGDTWQSMAIPLSRPRAVASFMGSLHVGADGTTNSVVRWNGSQFIFLPSIGWVWQLREGLGKLLAATESGLKGWDGSTWSSFEPNLNGRVESIVLHQGEVVVGGSFTSAGSVTLNRIARWNGETWLPLGSGMNGAVLAVVSDGVSVYAGGQFSIAGGAETSRMARWDGAEWHPMGTGADAQVVAAAMHRGELCIGGYFSQVDGRGSPYFARWRPPYPVIEEHPAPFTQAVGTEAELAVIGFGAAAFEWQRNGEALSDGPTRYGSEITGSASARLTISNLQPQDAGQYRCVLSNGCGTTTSQAALLEVAGGQPPCYANCDGSTMAPVLNVGDFSCFLQSFAAGNSYANCDLSTAPPVLNVADFSCFLQRFAAGCP